MKLQPLYYKRNKNSEHFATNYVILKQKERAGKITANQQPSLPCQIGYHYPEPISMKFSNIASFIELLFIIKCSFYSQINTSFRRQMIIIDLLKWSVKPVYSSGCLNSNLVRIVV
jgi:hypothetical protein